MGRGDVLCQGVGKQIRESVAVAEVFGIGQAQDSMVPRMVHGRDSQNFEMGLFVGIGDKGLS